VHQDGRVHGGILEHDADDLGDDLGDGQDPEEYRHLGQAEHAGQTVAHGLFDEDGDQKPRQPSEQRHLGQQSVENGGALRPAHPARPSVRML
jgi:hypothetical protein